MRKRVVIMGAAGRDFHNFNMVFRKDPSKEVVAFTAAQIPDISGKKYPTSLSGPHYPQGIPIIDEKDLPSLIERERVEEVFFSYSDIAHEDVMHRASLVMAKGAGFGFIGPDLTMIKSCRPVVSVSAVRTGCGKSPVSQKIAGLLKAEGLRVAVVRHPMPYGDLDRQICQRFETIEDLARHECTIEEMEEYEPHIRNGVLVFAGVDYEKILAEAEKDADVVIWDGGNNDFPFFRPDVDIVVVDPHRPGHELRYFPGETNFLRGNVIVVSKVDSADKAGLAAVMSNIEKFNPSATVVRANLAIGVEDEKKIRGKRVLVVEDGPTLTHGEMRYGAGTLAANRHGAKEVVDPRPYLVGKMADTFKTYPDIGALLPAMGYSGRQVKDLEATINGTPCDTVLIATPIDLRRVCEIRHDTCRVTYELDELGKPDMKEVLSRLPKKGCCSCS